MTKLDMIDDGFIELLVSKPVMQPGEKPVRLELDTFAEHNNILALRNKERDEAKAAGRLPKPAEVTQQYLNETHGLGCSVAFANKLFEKLMEEVDRLQKKDPSGDSAETPRPTDSPSGPTTAPDAPPA